MPPPRRPSDRDRSRAVELLRSGYLEGRISTETFEARVAGVYTAPSTASLRELLSDLRAAWHGRMQALLAALIDERPQEAVAAEPPPVAVELTLLLSHRRGRDDERLLLGRASSCDLVLAGDAVSRLHLAIERDAGAWWATDLGSTNGTWLDGAPIRRARLRRGACLQLADALLHVG